MKPTREYELAELTPLLGIVVAVIMLCVTVVVAHVIISTSPH